MSPTEKRGRVHSSTVTVAVLPEPPQSQFKLNPNDLKWQACCSGGPGGQSVNTAKSAIQLTHIPTGLMVRSETERSQQRNKELALAILSSRLSAAQKDREHSSRAADRRQQIGTAMRADKAWTVRYQDGVVTHHSTGRKIRLKDYLDGNY